MDNLDFVAGNYTEGTETWQRRYWQEFRTGLAVVLYNQIF